MSSKKTILVCPLNWGLGHATRMIPIINSEISKGNTVLIGSDGDALHLLRNHYPEITCIELPNLSISYGNGIWATFLFLFSIPKILLWIHRDNKKLNEIIKEHHIDLVISDNRWGLWNKSVHSVFVTHQVMVKMPKAIRFLERSIFKLQQWVIRHFDEIWIPDFEDKRNNLSGDLSHRFLPKKPTKYIGILSQFTKTNDETVPKYDVAVILSGPEPHRSILEQKLLLQLSTMTIQSVFIGGKMSNNTINHYPNISYIPFANTEKLQEIFAQSKHIICRSGYTSIMDLTKIDRKAILIPTPSQTEQEYLAKHLSGKGQFVVLEQNAVEKLTEQFILQN